MAYNWYFVLAIGLILLLENQALNWDIFFSAFAEFEKQTVAESNEEKIPPVQ